MQGYTDKIRKYAFDASHVGQLENPDGIGEVGLGADERGKCLAVRFSLQVEGMRIHKINFQAFGCGYTIAACSAAAELSEGRSLQEVERYTAADIAKPLGGLPADRSYCAELASQALRTAVSSAQQKSARLAVEFRSEQDEGPKISRCDPFYRSLIESPAPAESSPEDHQMFAGLLTLACSENNSPAVALGLKNADIDTILSLYFPAFDRGQLCKASPDTEAVPPKINPDVLLVLQSHIPRDQRGKKARIPGLLANIIAARAGHPGHLWTSMGFFERPQLTAAIRRHLPTLAIANDKGMRWKRYLFKQACDMNGGVMCQNPNCTDCSDYQFCFAPEDD